MKVVLFCGGLGTRLRDYSDVVPKPLVNIGSRPIIWHLMRYYAHYGHNDFILCLGYRGDMIKEYFLNYNECMSNDFAMRNGGEDIELFESDIDDWNITFIDTGLQSNIGQRLRRVRKYLEGEEMFMANYSDGLSDLPLPDYLENFTNKDAVGSFLTVRPSQTFHAISSDDDNYVTKIEYVGGSDIWINGGFMIFRPDIFDNLHEGEELVDEPFNRLVAQKKLVTYKYKGFWTAMDTYRDKKHFDSMYESGNTPWQVWKQPLID